MDFKTVSQLAPPAPPCFDARMQWVTYLTSAQACNKSQPFKDGKYRTDYQFCRDCSQERAMAMTAEGKCDAKAYRDSLTCGDRAPSTVEVT